MCEAAAATHVVQETDRGVMSYAVVLPVTDLEHVLSEIKRQELTEKVIARTRRQDRAYQNFIRKKRKEARDETIK